MQQCGHEWVWIPGLVTDMSLYKKTDRQRQRQMQQKGGCLRVSGCVPSHSWMAGVSEGGGGGWV